MATLTRSGEYDRLRALTDAADTDGSRPDTKPTETNQDRTGTDPYTTNTNHDRSDSDAAGIGGDHNEPGTADASRDQSDPATPDATEPPDPTDRHAQRDRPTYWEMVPRFFAAWHEHGRRWPERERTVADRSGDPPGSWRADSGAYLAPDQHARVTDLIGTVHEREEAVSSDVLTVAWDNDTGATLGGFEFCRKGEDRLKEKIAERLADEPNKSADEVVGALHDAIRYTFVLQPENYAKGCRELTDRLSARGHQMYESKNFWADPEYKGINSRWVTPEGQRFEVQFHTPESFHAKHQVTHHAYERLRDPRTSDAQLRDLHSFQRTVSSYTPVPDRAASVRDVKKEGR